MVALWRPVGAVAGQLEHLRHVLHVGVAQLLRILVVFEVVVTVGHPEASHADAGDHRRGVLEVRSGAEAEERADALGVRGEQRRQVGGTRQCANAIEVLLERRETLGVDRFLVHAARVVVANPARVGVGRVGLRGRLEDVAQHGVVTLLQLVKPPVARLIARQRVRLDPAAAHELVEVAAGVGGLVERGEVEAELTCRRSGLTLRAHVGACRDDADEQRDEEEDERFAVHPVIIARAVGVSDSGVTRGDWKTSNYELRTLN